MKSPFSIMGVCGNIVDMKHWTATRLYGIFHGFRGYLVKMDAL